MGREALHIGLVIAAFVASLLASSAVAFAMFAWVGTVHDGGPTAYVNRLIGGGLCGVLATAVAGGVTFSVVRELGLGVIRRQGRD